MIRKVLFPLALPNILNSLRLLFGLAFGYIMLAEVISPANSAGGLGRLIFNLERRGHFPQIYLILIIIPLVAYCVDRALYWLQVELLPYYYPRSNGLVHHAWKQIKRLVDTALNRTDAPMAALHPAAEEPVVAFNHVTKTYSPDRPDAYTAIENVTFEVDDLPDHGELVCVLGPSGCGKSTILKLIAGLEPQHPATAGEVLVQGRRVLGPSRDRGMVFSRLHQFRQPHRVGEYCVWLGMPGRGL